MRFPNMISSPPCGNIEILQRKDQAYLGIKHDCNHIVFWLSIVLFHQINDLLMGCMISMRHVQPSNIHSGLSKLPYHLPCVGRWADSADYLCLAPHIWFGPYSLRYLSQMLNALQLLIFCFVLTTNNHYYFLIISESLKSPIITGILNKEAYFHKSFSQ